ncbi:MAG: DUF1016 domain-containing protein [Verrucomicrobia bacterium]|nr:DUF1016 domain-containing protein [Verrucomicrobiota bacterium]
MALLRFYQAFPILATWPELTWSHYRLLSQVTDAKERHELGAQAAAQKWTARELEDRIRESASTAAKTISADTGDNSGTKIRLLEPTQGKIGIYKIVETHDGLAVGRNGDTTVTSPCCKTARDSEGCTTLTARTVTGALAFGADTIRLRSVIQRSSSITDLIGDSE